MKATNREKTGSVIVMVLVLSVSAGIVLTSVSKLAVTERQFNDQAQVIIQAKEAAEGVVECGFAQLVRRFESQSAFPRNALNPNGGNPLILTADFYDHFAPQSGSRTRVLLPKSPYNPQSKWNTLDTEIIAGQIPPGTIKFIDGSLPGNEFDPLRDRRVFVREVEVYGKATVENTFTGKRYTSHVSQNLQVRDAPLFSHAIFYNMDMEIAPGPKMEIRGGVHANGRMYIQSNNSLDFYQSVSSTGKMYRGRSPLNNQGSGSGDVQFTDGFENLLSMKMNGNWLDSNNANFRALASNRWNGNLQTEEHGIQRQNPVAIEDYVADDYTTAAVEMRNFAYQLIQPLRNNDDVDTPEAREIERQKFAYKAGLVIHVEPRKVMEVVSKLKDDDDIPDYVDPDIQKDFLKIKSSGKDPSAQPVTVYRYTYNNSDYESIEYDNKGKPVIDTFNKIPAEDHFIRIIPYEGDKDTVASGLYDKRQNEGMNIIEVDVAKLKAAVEAGDSDAKKFWGNAGSASNNPSALPKNWWNGIVYVQVGIHEEDAVQGSKRKNLAEREDGVIPAPDRWAVKVVNGKKIPDPSNPNNSNAADFAGKKPLEDDRGMTLVTNAPMYVKGHYNADGNANTGSATEPDDDDPNSSTFEAPAALIADAITILSENWDDSKSIGKVGDRKAANFTEVAAAILTGLVPSGSDGKNYSGGVENFPRFLEDWGSSRKLRYRGSMVCLFESEVAKAPWVSSGVYAAPNRDWGFNSLFGQGFYPPGTPNTRTFRRINYRHLTANEYSSAVSNLAAQFTQ